MLNRAATRACEVTRVISSSRNPTVPEAQRLLTGALINIGLERVVAGDLDEAVNSFRRALTIDPANQTASKLLALAIDDQKRVGAAR